jgi:hypothetical protein
VFPFIIKIPFYSSGTKIQVKLTTNEENLTYMLDRISMNFEAESQDFFEYDNIW